MERLNPIKLPHFLIIIPPSPGIYPAAGLDQNMTHSSYVGQLWVCTETQSSSYKDVISQWHLDFFFLSLSSAQPQKMEISSHIWDTSWVRVADLATPTGKKKEENNIETTYNK